MKEGHAWKYTFTFIIKTSIIKDDMPQVVSKDKSRKKFHDTRKGISKGVKLKGALKCD